MFSGKRIGAALFGMTLGLSAFTAQAQDVAVTPLGSHDGEFCKFDRAMLFVDPDSWNGKPAVIATDAPGSPTPASRTLLFPNSESAS